MTNKIKDLRIEKNLKQKQLAELLGISVSAYSNKENGKRAFKTSEVVKIAQKLKVNKIKDLF